jgi:hypothetical protein
VEAAIMCNSGKYLCAAIAATLALTAHSVRADQVSRFDAGAEGWVVVNGGSSIAWDSARGNPPGGVRSSDAMGNRLWYFSAPVAYRGDLSQYVGGSLSWDLLGLTTTLSPAGAAADVIIEGPAGRIGFPIDGNIDQATWQTFTVPLVAGNWFVVGAFPASTPSGSPIAVEQFNAVMANVTGLYIQGEYRNGSDQSVLDNVRLEAPLSCNYDYNQDENVDLVDAQQMAQVAAGVITADPSWLSGDLNGDENADLADAQILAAFVANGICGL